MRRFFRIVPALAILISAAAAAGAPRISTDPGRLVFLVVPGGSETRTVTIVNEASLPMVVKLGFVDRQTRSDGSVETLAAGILNRSCAPWLVLDERFLELAPWEKREVSIRADVPPGVRGSYWTVLRVVPIVDGAPAAGDEAVDLPAQVDVAGTLDRSFGVRWSSFDREPGGAGRICVEAVNTGNAFAHGRGSLLVRGEDVPVMENIPLGVSGGFDVEPGGMLVLEAKTGAPIPAGRYWIGVQIDVGRGEFVRADTTVEIAGGSPEEESTNLVRPTPPSVDRPATPSVRKPERPVAEKAAGEEMTDVPPPAPPAAAERPAPPTIARPDAPEVAKPEAPVVEKPPAMETVKGGTPPEKSTATPDPEAGEAPAPEKNAAPEAATMEKPGAPVTKSFRIQLQAFSEAARAKQYAERSGKRLDLPVYVEFEPPYHKVFVGRDLGADEARVLRERAIAAGYEDAWIASSGLTAVPAPPPAVAAPPEAPRSAAPKKPESGLRYRVVLVSSPDENEAADFAAAVGTVFEQPLRVEPSGDGFAVCVGEALTGAEAWTVLERAKSFGFEKARIETTP